MALAPWYTADVFDIRDETKHTKRFFCRARELDRLDFKPGQFLTFDLPIHEKKTRRRRSYSIASAPNGSNEFELVISHQPHGLASEYLWTRVDIGSELSFTGPSGLFTLPEMIETDLCFIATGTGIAPFRSMLLDLVHHPRARKRIDLVFGTRYLHDVLYREEMQALQTTLPDFRYHLTLSREHPPHYAGRNGYVHAVYEELFADKRPVHFYLCGWKNMIDEAKQRILAMGYEKNNIHIELYG
jgi:CDP-4-dehydro-6-deoxyglucose reductase